MLKEKFGNRYTFIFTAIFLMSVAIIARTFTLQVVMGNITGAVRKQACAFHADKGAARRNT